MTGINRRDLLATGGLALTAADPLVPRQTALASETAERLRRMMMEAQVPAAGIAVVHQGQVVATQGLGLASPSFNIPANARTLFHLGSVSKQLTAALVMELVEAGAVALDDPVGRHARGLPDVFATVPLRALLSHTGGVADYEGLPGFEADRFIDRPTFLAGAASLPVAFQPGEAWSYSNTGYLLLGYALADVTGRTYRELVTDRLLRRTGLREARVDDARALISARAEPHVLEGGEIRHAIRMDGDFSGWPDGGVLMSAHDAALWELALQNGPVPSATTVGRLTNGTSMASGRNAAYGAGWFTDVVAGHAVQYHSGSVPGFQTFAWRSPATRTAVTVMMNVEHPKASLFMRQACLMLMEEVAPGSTPLSLSPIADDTPELTARTLRLLARGDASPDPAMLAPEIARLIGKPAIASVLPNLGTDPSAVGWTPVEQFEELGGVVRRYRLARDGRIRHVAVAYAPDGRIYRVRVV